jgi:hypothetical protein
MCSVAGNMRLRCCAAALLLLCRNSAHCHTRPCPAQHRNTNAPPSCPTLQAEVPAEVASGKSILQPAAPGTPGGRPLLCTRVRYHVVSGKAALAEMERFVVLVLDTASSYCWSAANGEGKMIAMFDLAGKHCTALHWACPDLAWPGCISVTVLSLPVAGGGCAQRCPL